MKVKDFIKQLYQYNQEADVKAIAHNYSHGFSISYGGSEGSTKENCETVGIYIDKLNSKNENHSN